MILKGMIKCLKGTAENRLNKIIKSISDYGMSRFSVVQRKIMADKYNLLRN